ncbi:hypothetical protein Stsp01_49530 [Streptomyces sp. NBRC 13847]|nr:hypothetical protein Stsp01_49530 [Streptomyces sp. NBRC 13847]
MPARLGRAPRSPAGAGRGAVPVALSSYDCLWRRGVGDRYGASGAASPEFGPGTAPVDRPPTPPAWGTSWSSGS